MTTIVVGAAIIRAGYLLAQQRAFPPSTAGFWELPGGRVEAGEDDRTALARECMEELGVRVTVSERVGPEVLLRHGLVLRIYRATLDPPDATPYPHDHEALRWLAESTLDSVKWLPADRLLLPSLRELLAYRQHSD
jgi:8-oxo-dGTP diphosphatase